MRELRYGLKQTFPIFFTYLFMGVAFGVMMAKAGYGPLWSLASAFFVYAGSLQFVMVPLLQAHTPLLTMAVMAFFINARHIFYGVGMIDRFRTMGWRFPYMVFSLTDETYSVLCSIQHPKGLDRQRADFFIALCDHCYWMAGCFLGGWAGALLPVELTGIDFSATAFFVVVAVNQWRQYPSKLPGLSGLCSAVVFFLLLGPDYFLIPALSVSLVVLIVRRRSVQAKLEAYYGK